jgi:hypothetical protein
MEKNAKPTTVPVRLCGYASVICAIMAIFIAGRPLASIGLVIGVAGCLLPPRGQNRFAPGAGIILNALMLYLTFALSYWLGG